MQITFDYSLANVFCVLLAVIIVLLLRRFTMKTLEQIAVDGTETNWDDAINKQQREIEEEVAKSQLIVSDKMPMQSLQGEYTTPETEIFAQKAKELASRYQWIRKVRGDGNCFYRALAFAQCERIRKDPAEYEKFLKICSSWKDRLLKLGFPEMTTDDFCDSFVEVITHLNDNPNSDASLLETFRDEGISNYIVVFMRLVTSGYLQENEETYNGFIDGNRTIKEYCSHEVEPMFKECEHICITALTNALGVSLRIEYMDRTLAPSQGWHHDFLPQGSNETPAIHFLYRPGHYDILYKN